MPATAVMPYSDPILTNFNKNKSIYRSYLFSLLTVTVSPKRNLRSGPT